ncbi:hypothetical protein NW768_011818 [Fusarium equiseti]|uniref:Uncharacterized protein n=1 Tax=Fusarium equiseti TaxID=61235 RepID=A0ABQ8QW06_FUSEQ|nr:hypothetical protein NW768_011818 [Fusarium equiseti]
MVDRLNEGLTLSDCEELHCVFEYVRGMYGAVLAQCSHDTWFPDRPMPKPTVTDRGRSGKYPNLPSAKDLGLLFPDTLYFDGAVFSHVWKFHILPCLGLDLLNSIIQDPGFDDETLMTIETKVQHLTWRFSPKAWIMRDRFIHNHRLYTSGSRLRRWQWDMPTPGPRPYLQMVQELELQVLQSKIYRQRGWIFFRDSPRPQPTLPSAESIAEEQDSVSDWICLEQENERRRSQKWQDYWAGRTLEDPLDPNSPANQSSPIRRQLDPGVSVFSTVPRFFSGTAAW